MNLGEEFGEPKTSLSWFIEQSRLGISSADSLRQLMSSKVVDRQMPIYTVPVEDVALNDLLLYGPGPIFGPGQSSRMVLPQVLFGSSLANGKGRLASALGHVTSRRAKFCVPSFWGVHS